MKSTNVVWRRRGILGIIAVCSVALISGACGGKQSADKPFGDVDLQKADYPPAIVYRVRPVYPKEAMRQNLEGTVKVALLVDERGFVERVELIYATDPIFVEPALAAAKKCEFKPAMLKGKPIKSRVLLPFEFRGYLP